MLTVTVSIGQQSEEIRVSTAKLPKFRTGFFRRHPQPEDENGDPLNSELKDFALFLKDILLKEYLAGERALASDASTADEDIIEDV